MGFVEKDWFMRQLKLTIDMAASVVLGKDFTPYHIQDEARLSAADQLHRQLVTLLEEDRVNEAENLLFESVDPEDKAIYEVGLDYYSRLNDLDDKELARMDFSREEIRDGLSDWSEEYGWVGLFDELKLSWSEEE